MLGNLLEEPVSGDSISRAQSGTELYKKPPKMKLEETWGMKAKTIFLYMLL